MERKTDRKSVERKSADSKSGDRASGRKSESVADNKSARMLDMKRKRSQKRRQKIFGVPGVVKVVLTEETQKSIQCDDLNTEDAYKYVSKEDLLDEIQFNDKSSEFYPYHKQIMNYPESNILIWYYPDEETDSDIFALCLTKEAEELVKSIILKLQEKQQARLVNAIEKRVKTWKSQGSEAELIEYLYITNRPLIEIEVETPFPFGRTKTPILRMRAVDDVKDGYAELRVTEGLDSFVMRKKIDIQSQVAPIFQSKAIQAGQVKGRNNSTQYGLDFFELTPITETLIKRMREFNTDYYEDLHSFLNMNRQINFYDDEYDELARKGVSDDQPEFGWQELMNILGVQMFKGKMVSHISWHHLWSGVIIVAYVEVAPVLFKKSENTGDEVLNIIFGNHYAALYAIDEAVTPILLFQSPREIMKIACCPYDEYLLVGGLENGQIIIWDMTNRFETVRAPNVLSPEMKSYKKIMGGMIFEWMKNIYNEALVVPAALSDPKYSHKTFVTSLNFVHPCNYYTKMGKLEEKPGGSYCYQFITTGEDGSILIWDLTEKPKFQAGSFKPRKFRRLKRKPSSLIMDESPYKPLHLNMKPIYKITFPTTFRNISISYSSSSAKSYIKYELLPGQKPQDRWDHTKEPHIMYYKAIPVPYNFRMNSTHIGTVEGHYYELDWNGKEFDSGQVVNAEAAQIINSSENVIHDGPILMTSYSPKLKTLMTTGGRVFALWRDDYLGQPILWRRMETKLIWGRWDSEIGIRCIVVTKKALVYMWSLSDDSFKPVSKQAIGNRSTTSMEVHPRYLAMPHYGVADDRGFTRIFTLPYYSRLSVSTAVQNMMKFLENEIQVRRSFDEWQKGWNERHRVAAPEQELRQLDTVEVAEIVPEEVSKKAEIPYHERMKQQWQKIEKDRIAEQIRRRKQTDKKKLEKLRKPLQAIEQEAAEKKRKQKQMKLDAEKIFQNTIKTSFPNYNKKVVADIVDPYSETYTEDEKNQCFKNYEKIQKNSTKFIRDNPHKIQFSWQKCLNNLKSRRTGNLTHSYDKGRKRLSSNYPSFTQQTTDPSEESESSHSTIQSFD